MSRMNIRTVVAGCCPGFSIDALPVRQQQCVEPYQDSFDQLGSHLCVFVFTGSRLQLIKFSGTLWCIGFCLMDIFAVITVGQAGSQRVLPLVRLVLPRVLHWSGVVPEGSVEIAGAGCYVNCLLGHHTCNHLVAGLTPVSQLQCIDARTVVHTRVSVMTQYNLVVANGCLIPVISVINLSVGCRYFPPGQQIPLPYRILTVHSMSSDKILYSRQMSHRLLICLPVDISVMCSTTRVAAVTRMKTIPTQKCTKSYLCR